MINPDAAMQMIQIVVNELIKGTSLAAITAESEEQFKRDMADLMREYADIIAKPAKRKVTIGFMVDRQEEL